MTAQHASMSHHPAPQRERVPTIAAAFGLVGGPLAWFLQLCVGYALASWPCFPGATPVLVPAPAYQWTFVAMIASLAAGVVIALTALLFSWRALASTKKESAGGHSHLMDVGVGRTRFMALWGVFLSGGFALATMSTAIAFMVLPRCAI